MQTHKICSTKVLSPGSESLGDRAADEKVGGLSLFSPVIGEDSVLRPHTLSLVTSDREESETLFHPTPSLTAARTAERTDTALISAGRGGTITTLLARRVKPRLEELNDLPLILPPKSRQPSQTRIADWGLPACLPSCVNFMLSYGSGSRKVMPGSGVGWGMRRTTQSHWAATGPP